MSTRRRLRAAFAALVVAGTAAGAVPFVARAQTVTSDCQQVADEDSLAISLCAPPNRTSAAAAVPLEVQVVNSARDVFNRPYAVTDIKAELTTTTPGQQLPDPPSASISGATGSTTKLSWTPEFPTNGSYDLHLTANGDRRPNSQFASVTVQLSLAVAPHRPTGVTAKVSPEGKVTISWNNADREPDLLYYEVARAPQGSAKYESLGFPDAATSTYADAPPSGAYKYRVTALRQGAEPDRGIASAPSTDATAEVPESAVSTTTTTADDAGGGAGTSGSTLPTTRSGSTTGTGSGGTSGGTPSISNAPRSTIDLSVLNSARRTTPTTRRAAEPDPGFKEVLPFDAERSAEDSADEPAELGADEPGAALGQQLVSDPGERRRSVGFVAGGLLLFVLGMTGLFLKSEVKRADELDVLDLDAADDPLDAGAVLPVPVAAVAPVSPRRPLAERRARAVEADADGWDAEPAAAVFAEPAFAEPSFAEPSFVDLSVIVPAPPAPRRTLAERRAAAVRLAPAPVDEARSGDEVAGEPSWDTPVAEDVVAPVADVAPAGTADPVTDDDVVVDDGAPIAATPPPRRRSLAERRAAAAAPADHLVPSPEPSRLARARQARAAAKAARAAEVAAIFEGEAELTADDVDRHLADLAAPSTAPDEAEPTESAAEPAAAASTGPARRGPVRRTVAPVDDPSLDVPDPTPATPATAATPATSTTRKSPAHHARRAPTRLPSRPADDRRQGGPAVRPGGRGTGQGHRRVPVGRS